jgi:surfeit locus 1 family protein
MSMVGRDSRFWVVLVATVLGCSLTASMGFWQLRRAAQKESLHASMEERSRQPALSNADLKEIQDTTAVLHRVAQVTGRWLPEGTVYLDNRQMSQHQGFYVVTPLQLTGDGRVLYVQRGFVPRDFLDRGKVPTVPTPSGEITVKGRMAAAPSKVYELGEAGDGPIRQNLDIVVAANALHVGALGGSLVQLEPPPSSAPDGLAREWPQVTTGVYKHYGYAFQWFGLCALMVFLYVWFQVIAPRRRPGSEPNHGA